VVVAGTIVAMSTAQINALLDDIADRLADRIADRLAGRLGPPPPPPALVTIRLDPAEVRERMSQQQAAALLGISAPTLHAMIRRGELATIRIGRRQYVTRSALERALSSP